MADLNTFRENLHSLVSKFEQDKNHYLQKGYPEAQVRIDFLNPLEKAVHDKLVYLADRMLELHKKRKQL